MMCAMGVGWHIEEGVLVLPYLSHSDGCLYYPIPYVG